MENRTLVAIPLKMGLLLVPLACGIIDPSRVLQPNELCSDNSEDAIVTFEDANLEAGVIREDLEAFGQIGPRDDLTCGLLSGKTAFGSAANIRSLGGIQNLTSLTVLHLSDNPISDISPLSGLTSLTLLHLDYNSISEIQALLDNTGLGADDLVDLRSTTVSCADVAAQPKIRSMCSPTVRDDPSYSPGFASSWKAWPSRLCWWLSR